MILALACWLFEQIPSQKKKRRGKRGQPKKRGSRVSGVGDDTGGTDADAEDIEQDGQDDE